MPDRIKAIVLSDLHLGERTSAFSEGKTPDVRFRKRTAEHLARLLGALLATQDGRAEYLILAGDVLDLSLASRRAAFLGFKSFLEQIAPLFDTLIYVPGNHDHHIWVALQEEARIFAQIRQGQPVLPYYDAFVPAIEPGGLVLPLLAGSEDHPAADSRLLRRPIGERTFLYDLLPASARDRAMDFVVAYPNVHLRLPEQRILVTHGHFFEEAWTLVTDALPQSLHTAAMTYRELEQLNSPLTEFGWYHLGQAGRLADLLEEIWSELQRGPGGPFPALDQVTDEVAAFLDARLDYTRSRKTGLRRFFARRVAAPLSEWTSDRIIDLQVAVFRRFLASQMATEDAGNRPGSALRHVPDIFADPRKAARARTYLEMAAAAPDPFHPTALVFGHTHVPGAGTILQTDAGPVAVYNTGGWLVGPDPLSRPAIVLIEEGGRIGVRSANGAFRTV